MTDLVKILRGCDDPMMLSAADEIEELRMWKRGCEAYHAKLIRDIERLENEVNRLSGNSYIPSWAYDKIAVKKELLDDIREWAKSKESPDCEDIDGIDAHWYWKRIPGFLNAYEKDMK